MTDTILSGLYIYPIKSAAGIGLKTAQVQPRGLEFDRRWMVVDAKQKFMTQRKLPKMALIQVAIAATTLQVSAPNMPTLEVPLQQPETEENHLTVEVWGDRCLALSTGAESQAWFSQFLGQDCQLVYMPDVSNRPTEHGKFGERQQVSFADAFPFLLISEASLADLNYRLTERQVAPIAMDRFRPNLVVSGCDAFAEDTWKNIQIGSQRLTVAKACSRCVIPSINQSTGTKEKEPIPTLLTYRHWDKNIWFGQNLIHTDTVNPVSGMLMVGDRLSHLP
ncbi:MAG: MOSC N-terminal beta barrel domain-containing protein [Cyanobacteria bacterium P01_F01_bin.150]